MTEDFCCKSWNLSITIDWAFMNEGKSAAAQGECMSSCSKDWCCRVCDVLHVEVKPKMILLLLASLMAWIWDSMKLTVLPRTLKLWI